jgi:hypothetical protein
MSPKARVLAAFPAAKCTKDCASGRVVITLGATAHDHWLHRDRDTFQFSYGTAAECYRHVAEALRLPRLP